MINEKGLGKEMMKRKMICKMEVMSGERKI